MRRNLRRTGLGLLGAFVTLTIASLVFNAFTVPPRTTSAPSGADVQVAGHRIHYERWGDHGSPIVLVGGFAEWSYSWSLVGPLLGRDHVVYALDLPGYGYSQYTGRYTLADQTETVAGFIQALNLDRPALVGHSLGAAVVGSVGLHRPGLVSGVLFADGDALPFNGGQSAPPSWVVRSPYVRSLYRIGTRWSWLDEQIVKSQCGSVCAGYSPGLVDTWMRPMRQGDAEDAMLDMARAPMLHLTPEQIQSIRVPRAIIWGAEDATSGGSLADAKRNLHDPPTIVIPKAAHLSMIADPPAFAQAVRDSISRM